MHELKPYDPRDKRPTMTRAELSEWREAKPGLGDQMTMFAGRCAQKAAWELFKFFLFYCVIHTMLGGWGWGSPWGWIPRGASVYYHNW